MRRNDARTGFTIVELLVVITIIVVLLALLMPAMDRAMYQAELAVCGAKLRAFASATVDYAVHGARAYPYRPVAQGNTLSGAHKVNDPNLPADDRPILRAFLDINRYLNDPLTTSSLDIDGSDIYSDTYASYYPRYNWRFTGEKSMARMGDRFTYRGESFGVLVGDQSYTAGPYTDFYESHPDRDGVAYLRFAQDAGITDPTNSGLERELTQATGMWGSTSAKWYAAGKRGPVDLNFAYSDLSVLRFNDVPYDGGEAMSQVPHAQMGDGLTSWDYLPRGH